VEGPCGGPQPARRRPRHLFVLVAVVAQVLRNWLLLHAVGVDASLFDAIAVLIAVVTLGQLPLGPSVGAAAAVLILGRNGVAAAAAAGVLMTVTGTIGGLCFAAWAGADRLWLATRRTALRRTSVSRLRSPSNTAGATSPPRSRVAHTIPGDGSGIHTPTPARLSLRTAGDQSS
jgi:hypothetical protein